MLPLFLLFVVSVTQAVSLSGIPSERGTRVVATVGSLYLSLSGIASPYASVVLTSDGIFYRTAVADGSGRFYMSDILIKKDFSHFCLEAIDFRRVGSSYTCFTIPPVVSSRTIRDIFLPPTLALEKSQIAAGAKVNVFGFTMPNAQATVHINNGQMFTTQADNTGYYKKRIGNLKSGSYMLYADAYYGGKQSLKPTRLVPLKALSLPETIVMALNKLVSVTGDILNAIPLGPLWLAIPLLAIIVALMKKLWPNFFTSLEALNPFTFFFAWFRRRKKKEESVK